jgi:hypothetical protein
MITRVAVLKLDLDTGVSAIAREAALSSVVALGFSPSSTDRVRLR